jgi:hypothetical protein
VYWGDLGVVVVEVVFWEREIEEKVKSVRLLG